MGKKIDLRNDYDEKAELSRGMAYRKGRIVQVWWNNGYSETWDGSSYDEDAIKKDFQDNVERWSE